MAFQFKQFFVDDSACAMKVGTDSIILGSWSCAASQSYILDIGTGSGLLALMLAQKTASSRSSQIVAVEFEQAAALQAMDNVNKSAWSSRIQVLNQSIQDYGLAFKETECFDLIISNPPYFPAGQIFTAERQNARHTKQLTWQQLLFSVQRLLKIDGVFEVIIPADNHQMMIELAKQHCLSLTHCLAVAATEVKPIKRTLLRFVKSSPPSEVQHKTLIIHHSDGQYSDEFKQLCAEYYLNF